MSRNSLVAGNSLGSQKGVNNMLTSIALVTGANKGLGKEVARQLARRGFRVYLGSRDQARGEEAVRELAAPGLELIPVQLDVTSDESVAALAEHFSRELKHVDVLINNAGILVSRPALEITVAEMRQTYASAGNFAPSLLLLMRLHKAQLCAARSRSLGYLSRNTRAEGGLASQ